MPSIRDRSEDWPPKREKRPRGTGGQALEGGVGGYAAVGAELPKNPFLENAPLMEAEPGYFDLASHSYAKGTQLLEAVENSNPLGIEGSIEKALTAAGWVEGQPIRLLSCSAGDPALGTQAFGQKLSSYLRVEVMAPASDITVFGDGSFVIATGKANYGQPSISNPWTYYARKN